MYDLFWLTDANGPRLTGSPGFRSAADRAVRTLREEGAADARLQGWGSFGRGWSVSRFDADLDTSGLLQSVREATSPPPRRPSHAASAFLGRRF